VAIGLAEELPGGRRGRPAAGRGADILAGDRLTNPRPRRTRTSAEARILAAMATLKEIQDQAEAFLRRLEQLKESL